MTQESFFSEINEQLLEELPFVVYRKPGESLIKAVLQEDSLTYTSKDFSESGFVLSPFDDQRESILIPFDHAQVLELSVFESSMGPEISQPAALNLSDTLAKQAHLELVEKALGKLTDGSLEKVVLSRKEEVELKRMEPVKVFTDLLQNYPNAFVYCWFHPETGFWLGATPETLLSTEGLNFSTMALAGTRKFTGTMQVDWGEKEKLEQKYVTDAILENLNELKLTEELKVSETYTSRAGGVVHLRTDISGKLGSGGSLGDIVKSLHPTPAVCGLPREKAREFILEEENHDREYYTGFLGELNFQEKTTRPRHRRNMENLAYGTMRKKTALYVNLRCMKLSGNKAVIFVGGGITKDSVPEDEYQETLNKAQTMKKVIQ